MSIVGSYVKYEITLVEEAFVHINLFLMLTDQMRIEYILVYLKRIRILDSFEKVFFP